VRDPSGSDVLDPPRYAARRSGARVQVEHESAVGAQLERGPYRCRTLR
jgi:hypothetical protein